MADHYNISFLSFMMFIKQNDLLLIVLRFNAALNTQVVLYCRKKPS